MLQEEKLNNQFALAREGEMRHFRGFHHAVMCLVQSCVIQEAGLLFNWTA